MTQTLEAKIEREQTLSNIIKGNKRFTVLYGQHDKMQDSMLIPDNIDGLFLEEVNYIGHQLDFDSGIQYFLLEKDAKKKGYPLYLGDVCYKHIFDSDKFLPLCEFHLGNIESLISAPILYSALTGANPLLFLFGLWMSMPLGMDMMRDMSYRTGKLLDLTHNLRIFGNYIHPECRTLLSRLRNTLVAHKMEWLMDKLGEKHYGSVIGVLHNEIEYELIKSPEERLAYLDRLSWLWKQTVVPESLYQIHKLGKKGALWTTTEIYEIPELKELLK